MGSLLHAFTWVLGNIKRGQVEKTMALFNCGGREGPLAFDAVADFQPTSFCMLTYKTYGDVSFQRHRPVQMIHLHRFHMKASKRP